MTRINLVRETKNHDSVSWGKATTTETTSTASVLIFAAALIACSIAVGCSSEKPKPVSSSNQIPVPPMTNPAPPVAMAKTESTEAKPAVKKVVRKAPTTVNFADKTYGVTFEYPRRYAIETGDAATSLLLSSAVPMNFVQPGGVALAAVELPESNYANTDFSSAFFNVSVNKSLSAEQCGQFAVPKPKEQDMTKTTSPASTGNGASSTPVAETKATETMPDSQSSSAAADQAAKPVDPTEAKLLVRDMELRATEAVSGEGTRQSDSRYFHVYQNGACYEFAMNVATDASDGALVKHIDRDRVFDRLEKIMATVTIETVKPEVTPDSTAQTPGTPVVSASPAQ